MKVIDIYEFLTLDIPPRERIFTWMQTQSLTMIYAWRGVGKTHVALGTSYAIASGTSFLKWQADKPRKVLYIDGEMPANEMQDRLARIVATSDIECQAGFLKIITSDLQNIVMPDLATVEGQQVIDSAVGDAEVIIVDNLSCMVRGTGKENDAESWVSVQQWALKHRSAGRSIVFIHHSGKSGNQRGTSKKEDLLDTVICLKRPPEYQPSDGAVFEVHFEKARHLFGDEINPFEAKLIQNNEKQYWEIKDLENTTFERVIKLKDLGMNQTDIANELGVNKSTVSRHLKAYQPKGKFIGNHYEGAYGS